MPTLTTIQIPTVRPFQPTDAAQFVNRDGFQCTQAHLLMQSQSGPAFTAELDGRPVAAAGIVLTWPGLGLAWMVIAEDMPLPPLWLTRTVKRFLADLVRRHGLHRLEAVTVQDSIRNQRWIEAIGFSREQYGVARRYLADDRAVIRYERIED